MKTKHQTISSHVRRQLKVTNKTRKEGIEPTDHCSLKGKQLEEDTRLRVGSTANWLSYICKKKIDREK